MRSIARRMARRWAMRFSSCDRDRLRDEAAVELGILDLHDVDEGLALRHVLDVLAQGLDVRALLADDHAGAGRVDVDAQVGAGALDADPADGGGAEACCARGCGS